jgi:hypothetical protein
MEAQGAVPRARLQVRTHAAKLILILSPSKDEFVRG